MRQVPEEDVNLFYKLIGGLLYHVNQKHPIIAGLQEPNLSKHRLEDVEKLQEYLLAHVDLIDTFVEENPFTYDNTSLEIVKSWKRFVKGEFFIMSHLTNYSVFVTTDAEPVAYGVHGLLEDLASMIPFEPPVAVRTTLLPFKGQIIYGGIFRFIRVQLGANAKKSLNAGYQKAKREFGIITSLDSPTTRKQNSDEELLKYYIKSDASMMKHSDEIDALLDRAPDLITIYYQELGRLHAKVLKKRFLEIGVSTWWFAVYNDMIIASGQTKDAVKMQIDDILPENRRAHVYFFKHTNDKNLT